WFVFYREPKAPDMEIAVEDVDLGVLREVPVFWVSAGSLADEPSRSTVRTLLHERARRPHTVLDLDYRPSFWRSEDDARAEIGAAEFANAAGALVASRLLCADAMGTEDEVRALLEESRARR